MTRKKQRTQTYPTEGSEHTRDLISTLPLELLAEILSGTSPKEVLALARCSRYFCDTLVSNPCAIFIWKASRTSCFPPLPDPTPNFTEPAYAAYIFDGGPCEECDKYTDTFYKSFSLRLRICSNNLCFRDWREKHALFLNAGIDHIAVMQWLPSSEDAYEDQFYFRKSQVLEEYAQVTKDGRRSYYMNHRADKDKKSKIMDLSRELLTWKQKRLERIEVIRRQNNVITRQIAEREGWEYWDLKNAPSCVALLTQKKLALGDVKELDFRLIERALASEIATMIEKRTRAAEEQAYAKRREIVALDYHRLKSAGSGENLVVLPTLNVFREQPVIKSLQNKQGMSPGDVVKKLKDSSLRGLIDANLLAWGDKAKNKFSTMLGFKSYQSISEKKLHPVDRPTARFLCSKCVCNASKKHQARSLDFKAACVHRCPFLSKKPKSKESWSVEQFELDRKAIKVTRDLLALLKQSEEDSSSLHALDKSSERILCKSCEGKVLMNFEAMQRHSHRHEDMKVEFLSETQAKEIKFRPIEWGLCAELMSMAKSAPRKQGLVIYGCRHCIQYEDLPKPAFRRKNEETATQERFSKEKTDDTKVCRKGREKLMSFHGMRCHVFNCHGILHIADEDIYHVEESSR